MVDAGSMHATVIDFGLCKPVAVCSRIALRASAVISRVLILLHFSDTHNCVYVCTHLHICACACVCGYGRVSTWAGGCAGVLVCDCLLACVHARG